jgi:thiamine-phosphate pyrophosphorylase
LADCRLYLVTPPAFEPAAFADSLSRALDAGDVACVQLRLKDVSDDAIRRACDVLRPIAQDRGVAFIMNDRPDLALAAGCDGVHVGQDDTPYPEARRIVGNDTIVGVSCNASRHLAMIAGEAGADYVAFGPFFASPTKENPGFLADVGLIEWWSEMMEVPSVAIGGITPANCAPLVRAGADFLAVVSAVWDHPDGPDAGVRDFSRAISEA